MCKKPVDFIRAFYQHIRWGKKADILLYMKRVRVCAECEHYKNGFCNVCGCIVKLKASWEEQHCKDGKW